MEKQNGIITITCISLWIVQSACTYITSFNSQNSLPVIIAIITPILQMRKLRCRKMSVPRGTDQWVVEPPLPPSHCQFSLRKPPVKNLKAHIESLRLVYCKARCKPSSRASCNDGKLHISVPNTLGPGPLWLSSTWDVASMIAELKFLVLYNFKKSISIYIATCA